MSGSDDNAISNRGNMSSREPTPSPPREDDSDPFIVDDLDEVNQEGDRNERNERNEHNENVLY